MSTSGVEVPQQRAIPLINLVLGLALAARIVALRIDHVGDGVLHALLRVAVRVRRPHGADLGDGDHVGEAGGVAVDGCGAGEDDVVYIVLLHRAEEAEGSVDVDAVVFEGDLGGFSDGLFISVNIGLFDAMG